MALHQFLADGIRKPSANVLSLLGADKRDDANRARVRSLLGKGLDLVYDYLGLGSIYFAALLALAVRHIDVYERWVQAFLGCWDAQGHQSFPIKLRREADDRLDAAEVLLEHQPITWKHRTHQIIYALAWLEEVPERKIFEISAPQLRNSLLGHEGRGRANLAVISDNEKKTTAWHEAGRATMPAIR